MEQALELIKAVQDMVLEPDFGGGLMLLFLSLVNELIPLFPYALVLAGQLLFFGEPLSLSFLSELFFFVALPVGLGSAIGSLIIYGLAYFGGRPAIEKFHKYLHFNWSDVEKVNARFKGAWYDELVFFVLRSLPVLPSMPVNIAAGILRMRFWPYFLLTILGFTVRMMLTMLIIGIGVGTLSQ